MKGAISTRPINPEEFLSDLAKLYEFFVIYMQASLTALGRIVNLQDYIRL